MPFISLGLGVVQPLLQLHHLLGAGASKIAMLKDFRPTVIHRPGGFEVVIPVVANIRDWQIDVSGFRGPSSSYPSLRVKEYARSEMVVAPYGENRPYDSFQWLVGCCGSECSRKKRSISLVASGPRGSV